MANKLSTYPGKLQEVSVLSIKLLVFSCAKKEHSITGD